MLFTVLLAGEEALPEDRQCKDLPASKPGSLRRFGKVTTLLQTVLAGEEAIPENLQCKDIPAPKLGNFRRFGVRFGDVTSVL